MGELELRKIAFVAMPFRVKPTNLPPGKGPTEVDFDALWEKAIFPALSELDYMPIRADNQTGSVIIKDMLEQLVFADLVIADISIPNGNVYYEAGVRHAARERGCILISADWTRPLFDLAQISSLRYPFPNGAPADKDYEAIKDCLVKAIPGLAGSVGPVFELTRAAETGPRDNSQLKEISSRLFKFQTGLLAAEIEARDGDKSSLRALVAADRLKSLPTYALEDLVLVARDSLEWGEILALIERLPESVAETPFIMEQKALALRKQGRLSESIALLDTVIKHHGETPERLGARGGSYRELARDELNKQRKRRHQAKAIESYQRGMTLDLNQYYCSYKSIVALMERGRAADKARAEQCAQLVREAAVRSEKLGSVDEWLDSTLAVLAFFEKDLSEAQERVDRILDQGWTNWKLVALSQDLECALGWMDESDREPFMQVFDELHSSLPVSQADLMSRVLPLIKTSGQLYKKYQQVHARPAVVGETIVSRPADGEETANVAEQGDVVVRNLTEAKEEYIVPNIRKGDEDGKFDKLYSLVEPVDDVWSLFDPKGEVMALEISRELTAQLDVGEEFYVMAPWGSEQLAREGDKFVSPVEKMDEVYRVARKEFSETYRLKD